MCVCVSMLCLPVWWGCVSMRVFLYLQCVFPCRHVFHCHVSLCNEAVFPCECFRVTHVCFHVRSLCIMRLHFHASVSMSPMWVCFHVCVSMSCLHVFTCAFPCFHVMSPCVCVFMFPHESVSPWMCFRVSTWTCSHVSMFPCFHIRVFPHECVSVFPRERVPMWVCFHMFLCLHVFSCDCVSIWA